MGRMVGVACRYGYHVAEQLQSFHMAQFITPLTTQVPRIAPKTIPTMGCGSGAQHLVVINQPSGMPAVSAIKNDVYLRLRRGEGG